jgi:hypothetical protein
MGWGVRRTFYAFASEGLGIYLGDCAQMPKLWHLIFSQVEENLNRAIRFISPSARDKGDMSLQKIAHIEQLQDFRHVPLPRISHSSFCRRYDWT